MQPLNLPAYDFKLKKEADKLWIYDQIRKKFVFLTPEEWVRQHFLNLLINHRNYPKALIKVEGGLVYNQLKKRSDILVFDRNGKPWMIIECKAFNIAIDETTLRQVSVYNQTHKSEYVVVTNGLKHYCAHIDWQSNTTEPLTDLPDFA